MWMSSIASNFASQPRPVGQMIETLWPASRSASASCHTRRSNGDGRRSEEHTSELQSQSNLVCRLLLEKKKYPQYSDITDACHLPRLHPIQPQPSLMTPLA